MFSINNDIEFFFDEETKSISKTTDAEVNDQKTTSSSTQSSVIRWILHNFIEFIYNLNFTGETKIVFSTNRPPLDFNHCKRFIDLSV